MQSFVRTLWNIGVASFAAVILGILAFHPCAGAPLEAGIGVVDITPPVPFRLCGYFEERIGTGVKDPLHAKAVVFQQGDTKAALVFCDLLGLPVEVTQRARQLAADKTGIPFANIMIAATHSHTGPAYFDSLRDYLHEKQIECLGHDPYEPINYIEVLVESIVKAVADANEELQPVELTSYLCDEPRLVFNRRFHMKNGTVEFNPGQLNPDIIREAGPIDAEVGVVLMRRIGSSAPLGAIVSYALHLDTVGGTEYSADYPKYCEKQLQQEFGPDFTLLFGTGTCGDINHIDVTTETVRSAPEIGQMLADSICRVIADQPPRPNEKPMLTVRSATLQVSLQRYSAAEIAVARSNMALIGTRQLPFLAQVEAFKITDLQLRHSAALPIEVQLFRLADETAIVTLPGEVFVELGLAIKKASPFKHTLVIELANDYVAYIPTRRAFAEGSYETVNSRVQSGAGEQMVDAAIKLLKEFE